MLIRLFAIPSAFLAVVLIAVTASAQYQVYPIAGGPGAICPSDGPVFHPGHSYDHRRNVAKLDQWADELAEAAKHLHEDAHQLGQDYEHSQGIEASVDRLDRLNEHLHHILHRAAERHHLTTSEVRHVANDLQDVRRLAIRLDAELEHQRIDGARTQDFHALDHMRQILANEVFPLVRRMEYELNYRSISHHGPVNVHPSYTSHRHGH